MAICGCGLPVCCCQPAVAGGIIYADLCSELSTHLAQQALFTQSSVHNATLQAFPFPSTLGEVTLHPISQACVFIYSSREKWVFPLSCGAFLPPPFSPFSQLFRSWLLGGSPHSCPLRPGPACLFTVRGKIPLPASSALRAPHPLCYMSLLFLLLITQFLFFPQVGVGLSRGLCRTT
jgi:hypothetical protein